MAKSGLGCLYLAPLIVVGVVIMLGYGATGTLPYGFGFILFGAAVLCLVFYAFLHQDNSHLRKPPKW